MRLTDKVSIITGAGQGIGRATALKFASEGAKVAVCDINQAAVADTVRAIADAGGEAAGFDVDVTDKDSIARMVKAAGTRALIGAGTVLKVDEVAGVKAVGGRVIVSPNRDDAVIRATKAERLLSFPGVFTATEAFEALGHQLRVILELDAALQRRIERLNDEGFALRRRRQRLEAGDARIESLRASAERDKRKRRQGRDQFLRYRHCG